MFMKIAVTYENGEIFQHFGRTEQFKIYTVENGKVAEAKVVGNDGNGHESLAGYIKSLGADALICGGLGAGAREALAQAGVAFYPGASGNADLAVEAFLNGSLAYSADSVCQNHHHHQDGGCSH